MEAVKTNNRTVGVTVRKANTRVRLKKTVLHLLLKMNM